MRPITNGITTTSDGATKAPHGPMGGGRCPIYQASSLAAEQNCASNELEAYRGRRPCLSGEQRQHKRLVPCTCDIRSSRPVRSAGRAPAPSAARSSMRSLASSTSANETPHAEASWRTRWNVASHLAREAAVALWHSTHTMALAAGGVVPEKRPRTISLSAV